MMSITSKVLKISPTASQFYQHFFCRFPPSRDKNTLSDRRSTQRNLGLKGFFFFFYSFFFRIYVISRGRLKTFYYRTNRIEVRFINRIEYNRLQTNQVPRQSKKENGKTICLETKRSATYGSRSDFAWK